MAVAGERRTGMRERFNTPVIYQIDHQTFLQDAYDLSPNGIGVLCPIEPHIGAKTKVHFVHPREQTDVFAQGEVVHVQSSTTFAGFFRVGLRFYSVNSSKRLPEA